MSRVLAALLSVLALTGCAALRQPDQPVTLRLSPRFESEGTVIPSTIAVAPVQARGMTGQTRYTYVQADAPSELRRAKTLFWEEPPPRVLERALVVGLRTRFAVVGGPSSPAPALSDARVATVLTRFEEVGAGGSAHALVAFDATLSRQGKPVLTGSWCAAAPIADAVATSRATAFEGAITQAVARFVQDAASGTPTASRAPC